MATVEPDMGAPEHPAEGLGDLGAASDQVRRASSTTGRWSEYTQLSKQIKRAGLLNRRRGWYLAKVAVNGALLAAGGTAFLLLGDSWWQLLTAAYLAVVFTQIAFMGHDAGHRQIFRSRRANNLIGLVNANLLVGVSFGWWVGKHDRHHTNPNHEGLDPDIGIAALLVLSPLQAAAFALVHQGPFGLDLGCSFAPNHKGMPTLSEADEFDFLRRQMLTSRNVRGSRFVDTLLGGLNYQIEHHLFPSMPRPNLRHAQPLVREFCLRHDLPYTGATLLGSYAEALRHLHAVGAPLRLATVAAD